MNKKILRLLEKFKVLEEEVQTELNKQGHRWFYQISRKRLSLNEPFWKSIAG